MESNYRNGQNDLPTALLHIEALQKQLAEKNAELSEVRQLEEEAKNQVAQLNDMNVNMREWLRLGLIPKPGSDVLKQMSEIRATLMAYSEAALKAREPVVDLTGDAAAKSKEITPAAAVEVIG